ncbi:MAG: GGDEF domain-containing protein [Cyanobacteria bacterium J06628_6]
MTHQILLVGDAQFSSLINQQVRGIETLSVNMSTSADQAERQMMASAPDLVIGQAGLFDRYSIAEQYRQHPQLTGMYVVLVEDQPSWDTLSVLPPLQKTAAALESGADAYVWLANDSETGPITQRLLQLQVKQGLERARAHRDLQRTNRWLSAIALVDSLTQLSNRRALDIELPQQIKMAQSRGYELSVMMLDIDHFKGVNDRYGHQVGDQVLQQLAERLSQNMRFYDTAYRYGGEEFALILNKTGVDEARAIGQRLCQLIATEPFTIGQHLAVSTSVSIGVSCLQVGDDLQGRTLIMRADQNLLAAKKRGRNQVAVQ